MNKAKRLERNAQKELCSIIEELVHIVAAEYNDIDIEIELNKIRPEGLEKLAREAELKIKKKQIDKLKRKVLSVLRKSTNKLILATLVDYEN